MTETIDSYHVCGNVLGHTGVHVPPRLWDQSSSVSVCSRTVLAQKDNNGTN